MSKTQVVTLRIPVDLKARLENEAHIQGVSMNNLANYMLTTQISQIEVLSAIEARISRKNISSLKTKVNKVLDSVQKSFDVPEWDKVH
ncbi:MAG: toxin-antitoxin system HicB family antitoxin [Methylococcales symbiont of Iophon sp. n. MRB-2018]|nr:MAG: toxin-antitoxin system HicB family antitoxin [Methylococcales symbiont of Iophon sp. n. MRB-2018]KAF3979438.1 MAG: toxin-antitoxin system HicB family antitoxin [Methylococcales symbiont of Iophon sp. n. MRB-2018]